MYAENLLLQGIATSTIAWVLWKLFRAVFVPSSLDNIPGPPSASFVTGNFGELFHPQRAWAFQKRMLQTYGPVYRYHGWFGSKILLVSDPKALQNIVIKEQDIYEEAPNFLNFNRVFFGESLIATLGEHHSRQRKMLNPVFQTKNIRDIFPKFVVISQKLRDAIASQVAGEPGEIDMMKWISRAVLELVGQGGFGESFDSLEQDVTNPFAEAVKAVFPTVGPLFLIIRLFPWILTAGPGFLRRRFLELIPSKRVQRAREISDMMDDYSKRILARRKAAIAAEDTESLLQVAEGKDIMSVLLRANEEASEEDKIPEAELLGHISTLIFTGMETTSIAIVRILHVLAAHPEAQDKLREEVVQARLQGDLSYDELMALPYMEAVCKETLRLHAPTLWMTRRTLKDTVMPVTKPIHGVDGTPMSEIPLAAGTDIMIGIWHANINPDVWGEDVNEWKPERWLSPLPRSVTDAHLPGIYSNLMTFLGGGRACIGFKFAQMEIKSVLATVVESFRFELPEKEIGWNYAGIAFPTAGEDGHTAELPLKVSLVRGNHL